MIDSLKHWMTDYHINGFRFDLMGVHDTSTMEEVYKELVKIDPDVMVYGEPWVGGDKNASIATEGAISVGNTNGVAAFDDDFRDAIKGAEYGGFHKGQVQGTVDFAKEMNIKSRYLYGLRGIFIGEYLYIIESNSGILSCTINGLDKADTVKFFN